MLLLPVLDPHLQHAFRLENYIFDRYLHIILRISILLNLIIMAILIPLNIVYGKERV